MYYQRLIGKSAPLRCWKNSPLGHAFHRQDRFRTRSVLPQPLLGFGEIGLMMRTRRREPLAA